VIVDHQTHWYPPAYFELLQGRSECPRANQRADGGITLETAANQSWDVPSRFVDLAEQIRDLDEHQIDVMVVSPGAFGADTSGMSETEGIEMMRLLNAETARAQELYPDRVVGLAVLPMEHATAALDVLSEAIEVLRLRGVSVVSNTAQRSIADPSAMDIYRRIDALGVPLFLHPAQRSVAAHANYSPIIEMGLSWMFDTSAAALALVYAGVLDECPGLTVVHPHLGGTLPYLAERVMAQTKYVPSKAAYPLSHYFQTRFYTDSVGMTPGALGLAVDTYGSDRVLFASDYPWLDRSAALRFVTENLPADVAEIIVDSNSIPDLVPQR
jgi:predicted TIM-barrel fold metal-dependent hydrolase